MNKNKKLLFVPIFLSALISLGACSSGGSHEHSQETTWDYNANAHYHTCKTCKEPFDVATHTYESSQITYTWAADCSTCSVSAPCKICNYTYTDTRASSKTTENAANPCVNNGSSKYIVAFNIPGAGLQTVTKKVDDVAPLGHDSTTVWMSDENTHWQVCSRCSEHVNSGEHHYNNQAVTYTWSKDGSSCTASVSCEDCHKQKFSTVSSTGEIKAGNEATCSKKAKKTFTATFPSTAIGGAKVVTTDIEVGTTTSHTPEGNWLNNADKHWKICSVCSGKSDESDHTFTSWTTSRPATQTEDGEKYSDCDVCGYRKTVSISKTGGNSNLYNGYYSSITSWTNSADLINQLHTLIRTDFHGLTYTSNWENNQDADEKIGDTTKVDVVYSDNDQAKEDTAGKNQSSGWNREHAFCASLMTGYNTSESTGPKDKTYSRATDFHNLFASNNSANSSRSNLCYGGSIGNAAYIKANNAFNPGDKDKGRLARAVMYMCVMYNCDETSELSLEMNKYNSSNVKSGTKSIRVTAKYGALTLRDGSYTYPDRITFKNFASEASGKTLRQKYCPKYSISTDIINNGYRVSDPDSSITTLLGKAYADYRYAECDFTMGNKSDILSWNSIPVDKQEMHHNESVYSFVNTKDGVAQGNRNPFIDFPEFADYCFGSKTNQAGTLSSLTPAISYLN